AAEHRREGGPGGVRGREPGIPGASARLDALGQADAAAENGTEEQQMTTVRYSFSLARLSPARVSPGLAALLLSAWVVSACGSSPPVQEAASQSTFTPLRVGIYMDPLAPKDESVTKQLGPELNRALEANKQGDITPAVPVTKNSDSAEYQS